MVSKYRKTAHLYCIETWILVGVRDYVLLPVVLWPWGSTQPLTKWVPVMFPEGYRRPVRKADKFTTMCRPSWNLGVSTSWKTYDLSRVCFTINRSYIDFRKEDVWKFRGIRKEINTGKCQMFLGKEDDKHILFRCWDTREKGKKFLTKQRSSFVWRISVSIKKEL